LTAYSWNAADYAQNSSAQRLWAVELLGKLRLQGWERVLDLGCGDGRITAQIAARVPKGGATGVDNSGGMVAHARAALGGGPRGNLRFVQADAQELPFADGFDIVFSNAALHWVQDHRAVLAGIGRSLRPGGRVMLQMGGRGNVEEVRAAAAQVMARESWRRYFAGFEFRYGFYGPEEYNAWLAEAGLAPVRLELIAKDMIHPNQAGLEGWIRTTWLPYTERVPAAERDRFIAQVAERYLERTPLDAAGQTHVAMVRLEVEAFKPN
jgi:trans-aconitate 2-methyltransferase